MDSIYQDLCDAGCEIKNYESDLHTPVNPTAAAIVARYNNAHAVMFTDRENEQWYDIPFAYLPWWDEKKRARSTFGDGASIEIVPDPQPGGDVSYVVEITADGHTINARCFDRAHALRLFAVLDECGSLEY